MSVRPNILFVFPDQLRGDWLGFRNQEPVRTPFVDRLARNGIAFTRAWTPAPVCAPARACVATAREYARSPVRSNAEDLPITAPTIYRSLSEAGYRVANSGKLDLLKDARSWGRDGQHAGSGTSEYEALGFTDGIDSAGKHDAIRGYELEIAEPYFAYLRENGWDRLHAEDFHAREPGDLKMPIGEAMAEAPPPPLSYANVEPTALPEEGYCDNWIGRNAVALLNDLSRGEAPWFLTVNFAGPHEPVDVTTAMRDRWHGVRFSHPFHRPLADAALQQQIRRRYAAMIEVVDHWLGEMVKTLEATGALDNTLIVFASDHGEMLGDYNLWAKQLPFEASINVPLVMMGPMVTEPGRLSGSPVSLIDLSATILDLAGVAVTGDGRSLVPVLTGEAGSVRPHAFSGLGGWRAVTDGRFKLVAGFDTTIATSKTQTGTFDPQSARSGATLYDLDADPWETEDLAAARPDIVGPLWDALMTNEKAGLAG